MQFFQSALGDQLEYELIFIDYSRAIRTTDNASASYDIENISLEYEIVKHPELARMIANQYNSRLVILYDRIQRHRKISRKKSDTLWNINLNVPVCSMKGVLMLFEDVTAQQPLARDTESFYNPKIMKVEVTIEGIPTSSLFRGCVPIRCGMSEEVICTRRQTPPRGGSGGERPWPCQCLSWGVLDLQVRSVA